MKTRFRRSAPIVESLEGRQLLSTTAVRPPATPYVDTQTQSSGGILAQLEAVESQVGLLDARTAAIETRTTALEARVTALEARPDPTPAIASLQATVATQAAQIATLHDQVAALQAKTQLLPTIQTYHVVLQGPDNPVKVLNQDNDRVLISETIHPSRLGGSVDLGYQYGGALIQESGPWINTFPWNANTICSAAIVLGQDQTVTDNSIVRGSGYFNSLNTNGELWIRGDASITIDIQTWTLA